MHARVLSPLCALLAAATWFAAGGPVRAQDVSYFRIATGTPAGTYFPIGSTIANIISNPPGSPACEKGGSCGVPGLIAVAQTTQGSIENIDLIRVGKVESGLSQADIAYWAHYGEGRFATYGPMTKLRAIANLYRESTHLVVPRTSGITDIAGLRGRRVSIGPWESGTVVDARLILEAIGLQIDDYVGEYLTPGNASDRMRRGELDAFFIIGGHPIPAIVDLARDVPIDLLPVSAAVADEIIAEHPFFARGNIPGETYDGVGMRPTLTVGAQWVVSADVDADLVYQMTRAFWHERARKLLDEGHPEGKEIHLESALLGIAIPLHEGAERYYREIGILK